MAVYALIIARCLRHASQRKRGKLIGVSDFLANRFLMPMFPTCGQHCVWRLVWGILSAKKQAEERVVTAMRSVIILVAISRVVILPTIAIVVVWHDVVMIVMHHVSVAIFVVVVMMMIVVDDISAVTVLDRCDAVFVIAALVVGSCA